MYGMVINALEQLAEDRLGPDAWWAIREVAGVEEAQFFPMSPYPDEITFALVDATAEALDMPLDAFLEVLGRAWIPFAAGTAYGPLLRSARTLEESLEGLDRMHAQIGRSLPNLRPPSFRIAHDDAGMTVRYFSERGGLAPFVVGLLHGLAALHDRDVAVQLVSERSASQPCDVFRVEVATREAAMG